VKYKVIISFLLIGVLFFGAASNIAALESLNLTKTNTSYKKGAHKNPAFEEIERMLEEAAIRNGIPPVILKAVASVESDYRQFTRSGQPYVYNGVSYGILQVTPLDDYDFNIEKLKYDIKYNIECGAKIIKAKWDRSFGKHAYIPQIGNMDPRVLENWYFTLWAYNSWAGRNNPNVRKKPYQLKVIERAKRDYGQEITLMDKKMLPKSGKPDKNKVFKTPQPKHIVDFVGIKKGDIILDKTSEIMGKTTILKDKESRGKDIVTLESDSMLEVLEEPVPVKGTLMYKVKVVDEAENQKVGWAELKKGQKIRNCDFDNSGDIDFIDTINILQFIQQNECVYELIKESSDKKKDGVAESGQVYSEQDLNKFDINYDNNIDMKDVFLVDYQCEFKILDGDNYNKSKIKTLNKFEKVKSDKQWIINLDRAVDESVLNSNAVIVKDSLGKTVKTKVSIGEDGKCIIVTPINLYSNGQTYYMIINKHFKSEKTSELTNKILMEFSIVEEQN
jgi:hypothetical protein